MKKKAPVKKAESAVPAASSSEHAAGHVSTAATAPLIAKKDFLIRHNGYERSIRAGDDISDVPALYHQNLRTEGVL